MGGRDLPSGGGGQAAAPGGLSRSVKGECGAANAPTP